MNAKVIEFLNPNKPASNVRVSDQFKTLPTA